MILSLWRHGEAGPAMSDQARCLTAAGQKVLTSSAERFAEEARRRGWPPLAKVKHSPWLRTEQTAGILSHHLACDACEPTALLAPGAAPEHFLDHQTPEGVHELWVSHQPFVSRAIAVWCQEDTIMPLAPGGYAVMQVTSFVPGGAELLWCQPEPDSGEADS